MLAIIRSEKSLADSLHNKIQIQYCKLGGCHVREDEKDLERNVIDF